MRWATIPVVAASIVLSACLGQGDSGAPPDLPTDAADVLRPLDLLNGLTACTETIATFLVPPAQAQKFLPEGFRAKDAGGFFSMPVGSGKAAILFSTQRCETSQLEGAALRYARLYIYVEPPQFAEPKLDPVDLDFYDLAHYADGPRTLEALQSVNFTSGRGAITATATPYLPGHLGLGRLALEEKEMYRYEIAASTLQQDRTSIRDWQVVPQGLAWFEYRPEPSQLEAGTVTSCSIAPGSLAHQLVGATDCQDQQTVGVIFPQRNVAGSFHFLPGAKPAA